MHLYDKVNDLCKKKDITIYKMCKDTGINQTTVCNWKSRPNAMPALDIAVKMAKYFKVDVKYFMKG